MDTVKTLQNLVRAKYPIIAIETAEEQRVLEAVQAVADGAVNYGKKVAKRVFTWRLSKGLELFYGKPFSGDPTPKDTVDPVAALTFIYEKAAASTSGANSDPCIFVLLDFHNVTTSPQGGVASPRPVRFIRDIAARFRVAEATLILVSPSLALPPDLKGDVEFLKWPLPTRDEVRAAVKTYAKSVAAMTTADGKRVPVEIGNGVEDKLVSGLMGLCYTDIRTAMALATVTNGAFDESALPIILAQKKQIIEKSGVLTYYESNATPADVGGLENLIAYAEEIAAGFSSEARKYGVSRPRGIMLIGVPGTGKSLVAKIIGNILGVPTIRNDVGMLMGGLVGQSEANTRAMFRTLRGVGQCVVWIDEVEKAFAGVGTTNDGGAKTNVFGTYLTEIEEMAALEDGPFFVCTANDPSAIPPEFFRRFEDLFWVDLPNKREREKIFEIHLRKKGVSLKSLKLAELVAASDGYTGAEIEKVVNRAMQAGWARGGLKISTELVLEAVRKVYPISRTMATKIEKLRLEWGNGRATPASLPEDESVTLMGEPQTLEL